MNEFCSDCGSTLRPSTVHGLRNSGFCRIENILFPLTALTLIFFGLSTYAGYVPDRKDLIEVKGTVKNIHMEQSLSSLLTLLKYLELNGDRAGIKYIVDFPFSRETEQYFKGLNVRLLIDKSPGIMGTSFRVWEIRTKDEIILTYEKQVEFQHLSQSFKATFTKDILFVEVLACLAVIMLRGRETEKVTKEVKPPGLDSNVLPEASIAAPPLFEPTLPVDAPPPLGGGRSSTESYGAVCGKSVVIGVFLTIVYPVVSALFAMVSLSIGLEIEAKHIFEYLLFALLGYLLAIHRLREGKGFLVRHSSKSGLAKLFTDGIIGTFLIAGIAGSVWCYHHHICREGHLAHGFTSTDIFFDATWASSLAVSAIMAACLRKAYAQVLITFAVWIIVYRFVAGSAGGISALPF